MQFIEERRGFFSRRPLKNRPHGFHRRRHPFNLTVNTADLVNVQDMSVSRNGILATMLDFGDIHCQTASADAKDFVLTGIPNPRETQILVDRERDRERMRVRGVEL